MTRWFEDIVIDEVEDLSEGTDASEDLIHQLTVETVERIVWEVVPQLAETLIRERLEELIQTKNNP